MSTQFTKQDTHWIGGVVTLAAVLGGIIGIGTGSLIWGAIVTLVVGSAMTAVIALME